MRTHIADTPARGAVSCARCGIRLFFDAFAYALYWHPAALAQAQQFDRDYPRLAGALTPPDSWSFYPFREQDHVVLGRDGRALSCSADEPPLCDPVPRHLWPPLL